MEINPLLSELRRLSPESRVLTFFDRAGLEDSSTSSRSKGHAGAVDPIIRNREEGPCLKSSDVPGGAVAATSYRAAFHRLRLAVAALLLQGCAIMQAPDDWGARDTSLEVAFQIVNAMDATTTARIRDFPELEERSRLTHAALGPNPEPRETAIYFASVGLSHYLIARVLPKKWRPWFQAGSLVYIGEAVDDNCDNGLCR